MLQTELSLGHPVIVGVYTFMDKLRGVPHWMVLVGLDDSWAWVNDPGRSTAQKIHGKYWHYARSLFDSAWTGQVVVIHPSAPATGTISVAATLDGNTQWSSGPNAPISYVINGGPNNQTIPGTTNVPFTSPSAIQPGSYTLVYSSGGPSNATLSSITCSSALTTNSNRAARTFQPRAHLAPPNCTAQLGAGQTLAFTLQFQSNPPTAGFSMTSGAQSATDGQTLNLSAVSGGNANVFFSASTRSVSFNGTTIIGWQWTIDGMSAATTATFSSELGIGTHIVTLVVTDNQGVPSTAVAATVVVSVDQLPISQFTLTSNCQTYSPSQNPTLIAPANGAVDIQLVSTSFDQDGTVSAWSWKVNGSTVGNTATLDQQLAPGTYSVSLVVTDNLGAQSTPLTSVITVLAAQGSPAYDILHLGAVGSATYANDVNNFGQVAGYFVQSGNGLYQAFRTGSNSPINPATDTLGTLGGPNSVAYRINDVGQVVGWANPVDQYDPECPFRTEPNALINPQTDGLLSGCHGYTAYAFAAAINISGQAGGLVTTSNTGYYLGFRTAANAVIDLNTDLLGSGQNVNSVTGLNASGQAIGTYGYGGCTGFRTEPNADIDPSGDFLGSLGGGCASPTAINDSGQVVGSSSTPSGAVHAFLTASNAVINPATDDLGTFAPYANSFAYSVNAAGTVVGAVSANQIGYIRSNPGRAFVWNGASGIKDLNQLIDPNSGWLLFQANGINNLGQVVGFGCFNNQTRAFLLTPLN
jgi:probable HAF family extracellular repeat protein